MDPAPWIVMLVASLLVGVAVVFRNPLTFAGGLLGLLALVLQVRDLISTRRHEERDRGTTH